MVSIGNLITYRDEIEHEALQGSLRAALALAKMYDDGLGVEKNLAVAYAWLLIEKRCGVRDDDQRHGTNSTSTHSRFIRTCRATRRPRRIGWPRSWREPGRAMNENQKPRLWLFRTLEGAVAFIEEMTGEKVTPEEIGELRQVFSSEEHDSSHGTMPDDGEG